MIARRIDNGEMRAGDEREDGFTDASSDEQANSYQQV